MDEKPVHLTREGLQQIERELADLVQNRRAEVAERIRHAREFGDIAENAEYTEAKNEQGLLEGRILTLETMLRRAVVIEEAKREEGVVDLGAEVVVALDDDDTEETFHIVGPAEADPLHGRISNESPLGQALIAHRAGDEVEWEAPVGPSKVKIVSVR